MIRSIAITITNRIAITIVFIVATIVAVAMFSGYIPSPSSKKDKEAQKIINLTMWGTLKRAEMVDVMRAFSASNPLLKLNYTEIPSASLADRLTEAYANNGGPDLIVVNNENFASISKRINPVPFVSFSEANFKQTFILEGENFLSGAGAMALPVIVDPIIMYYNKSLLDGAGISAPPATWEDALAMASSLSKKDSEFNITQSALALGAFVNINNAKDIISMLLMQYGSPVFVKNGNNITPKLTSGTNSGAESAILFYTQFTDPSKDFYSWSRKERMSRDAFLSEDLENPNKDI